MEGEATQVRMVTDILKEAIPYGAVVARDRRTQLAVDKRMQEVSNEFPRGVPGPV